MRIIKRTLSADEVTIKYLQKTEDGHVIETGYYSLDEFIVCISSQVGCAMNCIFCATAAPIEGPESARFVRNLTTEEIVDQVSNVLAKKITAKKRILFSYMGMGEPLMNYHSVVASAKILTKRFPKSRVTISTVGCRPDLMRKLAYEQIGGILKLHLSLHAPDDGLRSRIIPCAGKISVALEALSNFSIIRGTPAKVNYLLINGVNDSLEHAVNLAKLLKSYSFTIKLSRLNAFGDLKPSSAYRLEEFKNILRKSNLKTCSFISTGTDIEAGCGQLRRRNLISQCR